MRDCINCDQDISNKAYQSLVTVNIDDIMYSITDLDEYDWNKILHNLSLRITYIDQALHIITIISSKLYRTDVYSDLIKKRDLSFDESLEIIKIMRESSVRDETILFLLEKHPSLSLDQALNIITIISSKLYRTDVYSDLIKKRDLSIDESLQIIKRMDSDNPLR